MKKTNNKNILGTLLVFMGGCFWGVGGVTGQHLLSYDGVTTFNIIPLRLLFSGFVLLTYCFIVTPSKAFAIWKNKRDVVDVFIYSFFGITLCQITYYLTIEYSNAGTATVLQYMAPVIILLITCIKEKRFPQSKEILCVVLAVGGVFMIATHGNYNQLAISPVALIVGLVSAGTVVVYNMQPLRLLKSHSAFVLLGWAMFVSGIVMCAGVKIWNNFPPVSVNTVVMFSVIVLVGTVSAFAAYTKGVTLIGPARASLYSGIEPVTAVLLSSAVLHTKFIFADILGFVLVLMAIIIISVNNK